MGLLILGRWWHAGTPSTADVGRAYFNEFFDMGRQLICMVEILESRRKKKGLVT